MPQQERDDGMNWKRNFNFAYALLLMHQRALVIPMRNRWGKEALGLPCLLAFVLMCLWAAFSRDQFMWLWIAFWVLCQIRRRIESVRLARSGARIHSQYDGWPFDAIRIGRTEKAAKLVVEPILAGVLGGILYWVYDQQGWRPTGLPYFLLSGVVTLPFVELVKRTVWEKRMQSMLDARLEQEQLIRDFRDKYGDS